MCFSAEADVVAGLVVTTIGVDALRQVHRPPERALGTLPVLLGAHLLVEAVVWWGETGLVTASTGRTAMWIYLAFALCVLPVLVPFAVRGVEPDAGRRRTMAWLGWVGVMLAAVYLAALVEGPVNVRVDAATSSTSWDSTTAGCWPASPWSSAVPHPCSPATGGSSCSA